MNREVDTSAENITSVKSISEGRRSSRERGKEETETHTLVVGESLPCYPVPSPLPAEPVRTHQLAEYYFTRRDLSYIRRPRD
ncbi:hypothetical protein PUN28_015388 [Cardiocondyla obscurior]|uniref:Uncharacterized protein n=1 Tax=Cardiocondyla obscurior TaxID=286306 RepID=A0AAW2EUJ4_9HYME